VTFLQVVVNFNNIIFKKVLLLCIPVFWKIDILSRCDFLSELWAMRIDKGISFGLGKDVSYSFF